MATFSGETRDWEELLAGYVDNAELLVFAEPQKVALEGILSEVKAVKDLQLSYTAARQQATQQL